MPKKRRRAKTQKFGDRLIIGIAAGLISAAILLAIFSFTVYKGLLGLNASNVIAIAVNVISSMLCGAWVTKRGEGDIIKCGLLPGIIFGFIISILALSIQFEAFSMRESLKILMISAAGSTMGSGLKLCTSNKKYHK